MSEINITVDGGTSKRLLTAGKYCASDIVVTAQGGGISLLEYENMTATSIFDGAYHGVDAFKSVVFTKVTTIGKYAFTFSNYLESASFPAATVVGEGAFEACEGLRTVDFPEAKTIERSAFFMDRLLENVSAPSAVDIGIAAFYSCNALEKMTLPAAAKLEDQTFAFCSSLKIVDLPAVTSIGREVFSGCTSLKAVILRNTLPESDDGAFDDSPFFTGEAFMYVPRATYEMIEAAMPESIMLFRKLEDYTVDGTVTGDLDESKI